MELHLGPRLEVPQSTSNSFKIDNNQNIISLLYDAQQNASHQLYHIRKMDLYRHIKDHELINPKKNQNIHSR